MKLSAKTWRIILASFIGALFTLTVLIDIRSPVLSLAIKVAATFSISAVAFAYHSFKELCKHTLLTLCVSFVFSGTMIAVYQLFRPPNMLIVNDIVYFEVNPLILLALTGVIYMAVYGIERLFRERLRASVVKLEFTVSDKTCSCMGKADTGCSLTEPFSGAPVIIVDSSVLTLPDTHDKRVIPYSTIGSSSLLYAVKADAVRIDGKAVDKAIYIAQGNIHNTAYQAVINSDIVR